MTFLPPPASFTDELLVTLPRLRFTAIRKYGPVTADDALQDVFLAAYTYWSSYTPGTNMKAWLFTIMLNQAGNKRRSGRAKYEVQDPDGVFAASQFVPPAQEHGLHFQDFLDGLIALPPEQQRALWLVGEGYDYTESAAMTGAPIGTLKSRVFRARAKLESLRPTVLD